MYTRQKPSNTESQKSRKNNNNNIPSFSSTLLDEIYRSIDEKPEDYGEKTSKRNGEIARACLVEKWMEKEAISRRKMLQMQDFENDFMFFSSTSSSNSDSSGALSDTEFFGSSTTTKPKSSSCFSARLKPVKTGGGARNHHTEKDYFLSDDYGKNKVVDDVMKSKFRALKIYANLKKVKQPISPGGKLTNFINSLFSSNAANGKKSKVQDVKARKGPSTCSSASSFSRSCLSKYSPDSREKMRNGDQRTVRFHPVSVIVDEDARPCGQKCTYDQDSDPQLSKTETKQSKMQGNRKVDHVQEGGLKGYNGKRADNFSVFRKIYDRENEDKDEDDIQGGGLKGYNGKRVDKFSVFRKIHNRENEDEDDEDRMSDASSDLFELDHLSLFGDKRFCEELPVYETTHFDTNRAIASGLIR